MMASFFFFLAGNQYLKRDDLRGVDFILEKRNKRIYCNQLSMQSCSLGELLMLASFYFHA